MITLSKELSKLVSIALFQKEKPLLGHGERQVNLIIKAMIAKAKNGDVEAAKVLFERMAGRPGQRDDSEQNGEGRIVIEWSGPPPPWAPKDILDEYGKRKALPMPLVEPKPDGT